MDNVKEMLSKTPAEIYPLTTKLTFGQAIEALKKRCKVCRVGWNGKGMWLNLQVVDPGSKMGHNYIYMSDVSGKLFPWNPNNLDMLAEDWQIIE